MMLISEKCQSAVCFLSSDGALEGEGTWGGLSLSHPAINSKVRITNLSLWPAALFLFYVHEKVGQFAAIRSSIKLWQTRLSNCNPFCNLSQTKRSNDAFGSTFLMCEIVFASICGLNRNGLQPPPPDSKRLRPYESGLLIQIHADGRHAGITSTKYAKVHTGLILEGSRYAATLLEDE